MKITTSLVQKSYLVLSEEDDRVIGIIEVSVGADITNSVLTAIKEDLVTDNVRIIQSINIDSDASVNQIRFDVEISEEYEDYCKTLYLQICPLY